MTYTDRKRITFVKKKVKMAVAKSSCLYVAIARTALQRNGLINMYKVKLLYMDMLLDNSTQLT